MNNKEILIFYKCVYVDCNDIQKSNNNREELW